MHLFRQGHTRGEVRAGWAEGHVPHRTQPNLMPLERCPPFFPAGRTFQTGGWPVSVRFGADSVTLTAIFTGRETGIRGARADSLRGALPLLDAGIEDRHHGSARDVNPSSSLAATRR